MTVTQTNSSTGSGTAQVSGKSGTPNGVAISATSIRHTYVRDSRAVTALWDFEIDIPPGQFLSIVGPSGCGKTTFLQMLGGIVPLREGQITIDGQPAAGAHPEISYMLARDALLPWRTALGNAEFGLEARNVPRTQRRERATSWLRRVHLEGFEQARVTELSQGMRQRVAIARTLAMEPRGLLMDEPFAALDAQTRALLQLEFLELWEQQTPTVVLITHDLVEAIMLSDRVALMSHRPGRVIADVMIDLPRPRSADLVRSPEFAEYHGALQSQLRAEVDRALGEK